jgi:phospholipid-translocating ATPase
MAFDERTVFSKCFTHIDAFATEGLRTLLYGYRYVGEAEYIEWERTFNEASSSLDGRQGRIDGCADKVERNFELLGCTAIEDKLQTGVPLAIERLRRADIKMWILTGDKRETAINVGRSCNLIQDFSEVSIIDVEAGSLPQQMASAKISVTGSGIAHSVVVIDGHTLSFIENDPNLHGDFIDLAVLADCVVCCRASPAQKASLVRYIRHKVKGAVTLAIGDGSNDIAMIQEAHVGIGITGKEGLQAARVSDYSIAQFRFLVRLLLIHGRWNYVRICKYTLGTFWKEMLFYFTQALYQRYNGYTGTSLYESWSLSMFNTLFTSLPVIFLGFFEKDLKAETLLGIPELYKYGQNNMGFNAKVFVKWIFMAISESCLIFYLMYVLYGNIAFAGSATYTTDNGIYSMGVLAFTACVIIIACKLQFWELQNKTYFAAAAMGISIGGWFLWNIILAAAYGNNYIYDVKGGILTRWGRSWLWWLSLLVIVVVVWTFELVVKTVRVMWRPSKIDEFQRMEQDRKCWEKIKAAASDQAVLGKQVVDEWEEEREREVRELLERPRVMQEDGMRRRSVHTEEEGIELEDLHIKGKDTRDGFRH